MRNRPFVERWVILGFLQSSWIFAIILPIFCSINILPCN